jgi:hypothetical protein
MNVALPRQRGGIPLADAPALQRAAWRTAVLRLGLALMLAGLLAVTWLLGRGQNAQPSSFFGGGRSGVAVIDFSTSIDPSRYRRIARVLRTFADTAQPTGLVVYSDTAYEAVPPGTRGEVLRPLLRFFEAPLAFRARFRFPESPWTGSFRGGTRISAGLRVARRMLERDGIRRGTVMLVSDLDDSPFDTSALTQEALRYRQGGIDVRFVPLQPSQEDRELFTRLFGRHAFVENRELLANSALEEKRTLVGSFPTWPVAAAALFLVALAVNERLVRPLVWGKPK